MPSGSRSRELERERGSERDDGHGRQSRSVVASPTPYSPGDEDEDREGEVELLLDPERPRVLERVQRRRDIEVTRGKFAQVEVRAEHGRPDSGDSAGARGTDRACERAERRNDAQHDRERG